MCRFIIICNNIKITNKWTLTKIIITFSKRPIFVVIQSYIPHWHTTDAPSLPPKCAPLCNALGESALIVKLMGYYNASHQHACVPAAGAEVLLIKDPRTQPTTPSPHSPQTFATRCPPSCLSFLPAAYLPFSA